MAGRKRDLDGASAVEVRLSAGVPIWRIGLGLS